MRNKMTRQGSKSDVYKRQVFALALAFFFFQTDKLDQPKSKGMRLMGLVNFAQNKWFTVGSKMLLRLKKKKRKRFAQNKYIVTEALILGITKIEV